MIVRRTITISFLWGRLGVNILVVRRKSLTKQDAKTKVQFLKTITREELFKP